MIYALIMAAGSGTRFGADRPKQFCPLTADREVIAVTVDRLRRALGPDARIVVVLSPDWEEHWGDIARREGWSDIVTAIGGDTRWGSVKNALEACRPSDEDIVLVHDAARPLVNPEVVGRLIDALLTHPGVIPVVPLTDSIRELGPDGSSTPVDRSRYRAVQTPQAFHAGELVKAYGLPYQPTMTDDASVLAAAGVTDIALVEGDPATIKITHPADIAIVQAIAQTMPQCHL